MECCVKSDHEQQFLMRHRTDLIAFHAYLTFLFFSVLYLGEGKPKQKGSKAIIELLSYLFLKLLNFECAKAL
jgi:hypothetical protein